jgi:hypothetical protein
VPTQRPHPVDRRALSQVPLEAGPGVVLQLVNAQAGVAARPERHRL